MSPSNKEVASIIRLLHAQNDRVRGGVLSTQSGCLEIKVQRNPSAGWSAHRSPPSLLLAGPSEYLTGETFSA